MQEGRWFVQRHSKGIYGKFCVIGLKIAKYIMLRKRNCEISSAYPKTSRDI